jgi:A/G-specific adenine glycosylase
MMQQLTPPARASFQRKLLAWFRQHRRDLPWRASRDPYRIWVAEVMLQQTRIAAVIPYYERFLARFPTVEALASARPQEVLKFWAGLGYYSRARNLHSAARYTAAAVLSIAYGVPLAVLDGNVARVLARLGAIRGDLRAPRRWQQLTATADGLLARRAPSDWNQGLMELGEIICTPQIPRCTECPVARSCRAYALNLAHKIPAPRRKRAPVKIQIAAAILRDSLGRTLLVKDPGAHDGVLFSRMWQFPAIEVKSNAAAELEKHLRATLGVDIPSIKPLAAARHGVTFRNITLLPFLASVPQLPKRARTRILALDRVHDLPVSSATRKIAAAVTTSHLPSHK